jgi:coenzyme F420 hydrogenase subunit beta
VGENEEPIIKGPCAACQVCYYSCPRLELPLDEIEQTMFGRTRTHEEETLGIYQSIHSARALDEEAWSAGQDGGTVIALAKHAVEVGLVDAFITSDFTRTNSLFIAKKDAPLNAVPSIDASARRVIETAGSKYTHAGMLAGLSDAAASFPGGKFGMVALPCELQGLRRLHSATTGTVKFGGAGIVGGRPILTLGLFCSKIYVYEKLVNEFVKGKHGIDPTKVTRTAIKRRRFKVFVGADEVINVPLKELEPYVSGPCKFCIDYTAELADISVGAIGSEDGWTTVMVRTDMGRQLFQSAVRARVIEAKPAEMYEKWGLPKLIKLAEKKRRENDAFYLKRAGQVIPVASIAVMPSRTS